MAYVLAAAMLVTQLVGDGGGPTDAPAPVADEAPDDTEAPPPTVLSPREYLYQSYPALARKMDCMISRESTWNPGASGAGGRYIGLAQFDLNTWLSTPPGRAGMSRYDPYASIDGMAWGAVHLGWSRWPVTSRLC